MLCLRLPVPGQRFETIAGHGRQVVQTLRAVEHRQLPIHDRPDARGAHVARPCCFALPRGPRSWRPRTTGSWHNDIRIPCIRQLTQTGSLITSVNLAQLRGPVTAGEAGPCAQETGRAPSTRSSQLRAFMFERRPPVATRVESEPACRKCACFEGSERREVGRKRGLGTVRKWIA